MKPQNELALIVAYYLSRSDKKGYLTLGYKSFNEAAKKIGWILDVKPNTVKNMRDEFDPYHQNNRIGWKRELRGSRKKIIKSFQEIDDEILFEVVKEILHNKEFKKTEQYEDIRALFGDREKSSEQGPSVFILRGPTGEAAESFFVEYFRNTAKPVSGKLIDSRDLGCGYDFEIQNNGQSHFVEVKGLASNGGGILFTNKEWQTALKNKERYYLVLVKNLSVKPQLLIVKNPASKLKVKKNIYTTIQVSWTVSDQDLPTDLGKIVKIS